MLLKQLGRFVAVVGMIQTVLWGQQVAGRLTGSVQDPTGAMIPGAKVSLALPGTSKPVLETETTDAGAFHVIGIRPDFYDVTVEKAGFKKFTQRGVKVDPALETVLTPFRMEAGSVSEVVEVTETLASVQTSNAEVATTMTTEQVRALPQLDRQVVQLFTSQLGVMSGRGTATVNGQRSTYTTITLDGVNVQDNLFRENGIDFLPNRLTTDQVSEFTVFTANSNASVGGGSSVILSTKSGTNEYHGNVYWYNRNNATAAGDWFQNRDGIKKAFLNQNQIGVSMGGPILKNKLLFYTNYELMRRRQQNQVDRTVLTASARQGLFTYRDASLTVRQVNVLQLAGVQADAAMQQIISQIPGPDKINNFRTGDSRPGVTLNSGGYSFNAGANSDRDNVTSKLDYYLSPKHVLGGSYLWNRDTVQRSDSATIFNDFSTTPKVKNDSARNLFSGSYRWNPKANFTNDLRGGANLAPAAFTSSQEFGAYIATWSSTLASNPINTFRNQGRDTKTMNLSDTASWNKGKHNVNFGFQAQRVGSEPYNDAAITPTYTLALGTGAGRTGLSQTQLPGISANDFAVANNLLSMLAGYVDSYAQTFNVTSRTSGFVNGAGERRSFGINTYSWFGQDQYKFHKNLTLTLGVRYQLSGVVDEKNGLALMPLVQGGNVIASLTNPNNTVDFAGSSVGRPFYNRDRNDFGPNIGFAWDPFSNGKTSVRGGYSVAFVDDNHLAAIRNSVVTSDGLSTSASRSGLSGTLSVNRPAVPTPVFKVPRSYADSYAVNTGTAFAMPDPNLRTPYVQQWNFGIQQQVKGNVIEVRYVGNKGTKLLRGLDYNQVLIKDNGFYDDFMRAYSNGNLARAQTGSFNPNYNPAISGSQQLTVFPRLGSGGLLTNATVVGLIQRGEVGELANTYQTNGLNGALNFYRNPNGLGNNLMTNYSNSSYHAFQMDYMRRMKNGLQLQANYNFSKVLSDSLGDGQARFEALLDGANGKIERARAPFDIRQQFKANGVWQLPLGSGHKFGGGKLDKVLGGWNVSANMVLQTGTPYSILSTRGTLNRQARSLTTNTATAVSSVEGVTGLFMTGNGPYFVNPANIGVDGRGAAADGLPRFAGQVFANPTPGNIGALQRRQFSGPSAFNMNASLQKTVKIGERQSLEIRADSFNFTNHPSFSAGDETVSRTRFDINQATFGVINTTQYDRRLFQFGAYYRF